MNTLRALYHLARADFLERVRRYSFLLMLAAMVYLGFAINRGDFYLSLDGYRGVLNSAWVGGMMTASATFVLTLFGFFLVNNTIKRDIQTGVGQIIATTPISQPIYLLGKWLSNWAVLSALLGILALAAVVMQLLGGESKQVDPFALLSPFLFIALPALALTAALAVLFESISWLQGSLGNVVYSIVWMFSFIIGLETKVHLLDFSGILLISKSMGTALKTIHPADTGGFVLTGLALPQGGLKTFEFLGIQWAAEILFGRLLWLVWALGLALLGSLFFWRFDPSYENRNRKKKSVPIKKKALPEATPPAVEQFALPVRLGTLTLDSRHVNFFHILLAELRLLLKGQRWWWYAIALGLTVAQLFSPLEIARQGLLLTGWIWPLMIWSGMGCRESSYNTHQIVFSAPYPIAYQLPATWLAGFLVTALAGSGIVLRLLAAGEVAGVLSWLGGAVFIPSLALALGVWSGSSKAFEVIYVLWWYLGPMHPREMTGLDFIGIAGHEYWPIYSMTALGLFLCAVLGRQQQLKS
jgi:hypothetical protein